MRYLVERPFDLSALASQLTDLQFRGEGQELVVQAPKGWTASKINAAVVPCLLATEAGLLEIRAGQSLEDAYMEGQQARIAVAHGQPTAFKFKFVRGGNAASVRAKDGMSPASTTSRRSSSCICCKASGGRIMVDG